MSKRVAEIVIDTLQQAGVRRCYGIVGDTLNHVTDAMHRSDIEWVHVRHEEVAAFAAGADSLVSGQLTACAGSCGPGGLHFINGIFESNRNRAPMVLIAATLGQGHVLWQIGAFFSQLAIVTFGGAYAVLAYMAQEAVQGFGWLQANEMADGLGLAETTPGPLILVTQFVGTLAAYRTPEPFTPMIAALLGAGLTTWVTFAPCFLWIFALAPWIDRLGQAVWLKGGLAAVTAAVVGVIANLTAWFALHVLFARVATLEAGPLRLSWPDLASFDWRAGALAVAALVLAFGAKWGVLRLLGAAALGGLALGLAF